MNWLIILFTELAVEIEKVLERELMVEIEKVLEWE